MFGLIFKGDRRVALERFRDPTPGPHQVVVEIKASGMCGSDLHSYRRATANSNKIIAGHEPSGIVAALGPGVAGGVARVGARVMVHH
jgi:D-arabinose 1-dehydrogenase-like Zn-dependent alcohol dehydrogenase